MNIFVSEPAACVLLAATDVDVAKLAVLAVADNGLDGAAKALRSFLWGA
jgi:hypothetical protein